MNRLRVLHDGILVGIGTALVDNPQLNGNKGLCDNSSVHLPLFLLARHLSTDDLVTAKQPQPIVLDPLLQLPSHCKLIKNFQSNTGKQPWVIATEKGAFENKEKRSELENAGVKVYLVKTETDRIPLPSVLELLRTLGIKSLMIEGGAKIIQSCLKSQAYNQLVITVAPRFIGKDGIDAAVDELELKNVKYQTMGRDVVLSATPN
ncbi:riboflavin biosynthesis protein RibD domain-containing protein [Rhizopus delemar RA 99-880]|uniref:2,5-diamino-6-ribosylamino-4(3H)-pyrimidinone 5'-phosphate reductase n=1 Tax=Rhizopus delemar (strain RA 99-880 / ATCC MYA-4621 / FGSC 9543 / NRRL 43880) TaxID=246409 RepID=I1CIP7_RHIO9|nr:riboflavin biosynthesis protein RibD domain-containing protein [Rhizopus delemar RA 99-880]|eukprot:EIE88327.1 riboflavin biosynthesis protein RibD domain-containing protein [Rhizopus delemar RA 99-880]